MPYRDDAIVSGEYYHLFNRGANRQLIFFEPENQRFFLQRLAENLLPVADLLAYCLMPNHYHLLIRCTVGSDAGTGVPRAMQRVGISYAKAMNKRYGRTGPLFEGRFQSRLIDDPDYFGNISAYIHLNPVAAQLVTTPEEWAASSYREYVGQRRDPLVTPGPILALFGTPERYAAFVRTYRDADQGKIVRWALD